MARFPKRVYLWVHVGALMGALSFYFFASSDFAQHNPIFGCAFHGLLRLYCPFCGGTRALASLLRLDFPEALRYNAFVCLFVIGMIVWDGILLVRMLRKQEKWWVVPRWYLIFSIVFFCSFFVLRNLLMILWKYDPLGDLGVFWTS